MEKTYLQRVVLSDTYSSLNDGFGHGYQQANTFRNNDDVVQVAINRVQKYEEIEEIVDDSDDLYNFKAKDFGSAAVDGGWPAESQHHTEPGKLNGLLRCHLSEHNFKQIFLLSVE